MTHLIGLDWGTTNLRAYLLGAGGVVMETRRRPYGIRNLPDGGFNAALSEITSGWPQCLRLACGMVGARGGWQEMPYLDLPVNPDAICNALGTVTAADGSPVHLVPGLRNQQRPDVMRGEETQVMGAIHSHAFNDGEATLLLPGTHSKWVSLQGASIVDFRTMMTGELYSIVLEHSILGAGLDATKAVVRDGIARAAFRKGVGVVLQSAEAGMLSRLFVLRAWQLSGELAATDVASCLSGMMIAEEVRAKVADIGRSSAVKVHLIGELALCQLYREALAMFAIDAVQITGDAAVAGLWNCACRAGLIHVGDTA